MYALGHKVTSISYYAVPRTFLHTNSVNTLAFDVSFQQAPRYVSSTTCLKRNMISGAQSNQYVGKYRNCRTGEWMTVRRRIGLEDGIRYQLNPNSLTPLRFRFRAYSSA